MTEEEIVEIVRKFQERRRRAHWLGWPLVAIGFGSFMLPLVFLKFNEPAEPASILIALAGFAVAIAGILIVHFIARCPVCNALPRTMTADGSIGVLTDPTECPKCRVRLK